MISHVLRLALPLVFVAALAHAQTFIPGTVTTTPSISASAQVTRPANITNYTSGSIVCSSTVTQCSPLALTVAARANGTGYIETPIQLIKSSTGTTGASFNIHFYSATPTLTGLTDGSAFTPLYADTAIYLGYATCGTPTVNGDNVSYQCTPAGGGNYLPYLANASQNVDAVIQTANTYNPGSGETFVVKVFAGTN